MTDDIVARLRNEGDDEAVEALRFQEASIRRLERDLAAAEARVRELEAELADQQAIAKYNREQTEAAERAALEDER